MTTPEELRPFLETLTSSEIQYLRARNLLSLRALSNLPWTKPALKNYLNAGTNDGYGSNKTWNRGFITKLGKIIRPLKTERVSNSWNKHLKTTKQKSTTNTGSILNR